MVRAYAKDGINDYVVHGRKDAVNPAHLGTKASAHYVLDVGAGESRHSRSDSPIRSLSRRLRERTSIEIFADRIREADEFYAQVIPAGSVTGRPQCDAAGFRGFAVVETVLSLRRPRLAERRSRPCLPPPEARKHGRNHEWTHLYNADVISMPDKWEYPWYAAWDLAFHCVPLALVDSEFAKEQLMLMVREWYMHPNGQLPAYEWALGDVNPPVHAWAAWRVYKIEKKRRGVGDRTFLQRIFHKLLLNFTWWVNRKDTEGRNVFQGGFLGLDNIGVFDRSAPLPTGGHIEQADGTGWMAMYCLNLLAIALELAHEDPAYEDVASKFWEHFLYIANAINHLGEDGAGMWDEEDGFFYDVLHMPDGSHMPLCDPLDGRPDPAVRGGDAGIRYCRSSARVQAQDGVVPGEPARSDAQRCLHEVTGRSASGGCCRSSAADQLRRVLRFMLDETEFLSPYGIRALSRIYKDNPFVLPVNGSQYTVAYEPAESSTGLFGGNSNWRGPIWFPVNFLLIESLQKLHHYLRRRLQGGVPDRLRKLSDSLGSFRRAIPPAYAYLSPRTKRASSRPWP